MEAKPPATTKPPFKVPPVSSLGKTLPSCNSDLSQSSSQAEEKKRIPPIKAPVGLAKSPDLTKCKSKIGSLANIKHSPAGGRVKIETQRLNWSAKSKVGSLENAAHKPAEAKVRVETRKLEWKTSSKVQSLQNIKHKPGGGNVKIFDESYHKNKGPAASLAACETTNHKPPSASTAAATTTTNPSSLERTTSKGEQARVVSKGKSASSTTTTTTTSNNNRETKTGSDRLSKNLKSLNLRD